MKNGSAKVIHEAMMMLKLSRYAALPTDKDGGFCLIDKEVLFNMGLETMSTENYARSNVAVSSVVDDVVAEFGEMIMSCKPHAQDNHWRSAMMSDFRFKCPSGTISKLQNTIKTHKEAGDVKLRATHATQGSPLTPAMRFISWCIKPVLDGLPHIARDSAHLVDILSKISLPTNCRFYKIDIRDFFMSGLHYDLVDLRQKRIPEEHRSTFKKIAAFILDSQYVSLMAKPEICWKVKIGSGMGVACAGDISNLAFSELCERGFLS